MRGHNEIIELANQEIRDYIKLILMNNYRILKNIFYNLRQLCINRGYRN